jgi:hypothetical protein
VSLRRVVPLTTLTIGLVPTPIMAERVLETEESLLFAFANLGVNEVTVTIDTAERASGPYDGAVYTVVVPGGEQGSLLVEVNLRRLWRVTGVAAVGASDVAWTLKSVPRS